MIEGDNMPRPIWQDEVWEPYNDSRDPQYELENNRLIFLNEITQTGTAHNAGSMNNLFYFYNLMGMQGTKYKTSGLGTSTITEIISDASTDELIASNVSQKISDSNWIITEKLYLGSDLVQERRIEYIKVGNEWEAIIT